MTEDREMKNRKITIAAVVFLLLSTNALADLCIVRGYVSLPDGSPAPSALPVSITEYGYDATFPLMTGIDWPYPNFYLQAFRCELGDLVGIMIDNSNYYYTQNFTIKENVNDINIILIEKKGGGSSGGGGGGGGGSTNIKIPATQGAVVWLEQKQLIEIFTYDKWFDIRRYIAEAYKITDDSIELIFREPNLDIGLRVGQNQSVDLNGDGFFELTMRLDKVVDRKAHMSFIRNTEGALVEKPAVKDIPAPVSNATLSMPSQVNPAFIEPVPEHQGLQKRHLLLLIVIADLMIILIIELRRRKRHEEK